MELVEKTIGCCLKERAECTPNGVCIVCDGKEYVWKQLWSEAEKIRLWLSGQGIRQHERVALIGKSSFMWISAFYALTGLGAVVVPISHLYKKQEVSVVLKSMEIQHILFDEESGKVLDGLDRCEFPCLKSVNIFGSWLRSEAERKIEEPCFKTDNPYDTACILLTSGSTGYPKGVMLSHYSLINNSRGMCEITGWGEEDRICFLYHYSIVLESVQGFWLPLFQEREFTYVRGMRQKPCFKLWINIIVLCLMVSQLCFLLWFITTDIKNIIFLL